MDPCSLRLLVKTGAGLMFVFFSVFLAKVSQGVGPSWRMPTKAAAWSFSSGSFCCLRIVTMPTADLLASFQAAVLVFNFLRPPPAESTRREILTSECFMTEEQI